MKGYVHTKEFRLFKESTPCTSFLSIRLSAFQGSLPLGVGCQARFKGVTE